MTNISLEQRKIFVGASETADLFGVGFKSRWQLWLEKSGRIEPEDLSQNENVQACLHMEPAIASWASEKWGMKLRKVKRYIAHPKIKRFGCSLDYESQEGALVPAEIKWSQSRDMFQTDGDTITDAPLNYLLQLQTQMACTGAKEAWLIVLLQGRLYRMKVARHEGTIQKIEAEVKAFWQSVDDKKEPKPDFSVDGAMIASLMQVNKERVVDFTKHNHLPVLCEEYTAAVEAEKAAVARKEAAMAEIRTICGDAGKALVVGFTISTSRVKETAVNYIRKAYVVTKVTANKEKKP